MQARPALPGTAWACHAGTDGRLEFAKRLPDERPRLRPSARPFGLFAAGGRADRSRASPNSPRPTASRRWRSPTPTTCSARWSSPRSSPATASSRSSAARSRSISATASRTPRTGGPAAHLPRHRPARGQRGGLSAADAAVLAGLPRDAVRRQPHIKLDWLEGETDGPDRAHRRARRPARPGDSPPARRSAPPRAASACSGSSATGSMSSCSATACRSERLTEPALVDLAYAQRLPLVATNEPFFARATTTRPMTR